MTARPISTATAVASPERRVGGPLALTAVTLGLLTWPMAFNLGAYGDIFYDDIFRVVVASSILFLITIANSGYPSPWYGFVPITLAAPLLWFLTAAWVEGSTLAALDRRVLVVGIVLILVVSVPVTLRLLIDLLLPEQSQAGSRRILATIVGIPRG